jgi:hypothetical protein
MYPQPHKRVILSFPDLETANKYAEIVGALYGGDYIQYLDESWGENDYKDALVYRYDREGKLIDETGGANAR